MNCFVLGVKNIWTISGCNLTYKFDNLEDVEGAGEDLNNIQPTTTRVKTILDSGASGNTTNALLVFFQFSDALFPRLKCRVCGEEGS